MGGNLFWGNHLRYFGDKISLNRRSSLISLILHQNNAKHYCHYFDCRGFATNLKKLVIARKSIGFSWQSKQNNLHEVQTESRPIRGAKNRIQGCSSATADFLLESEKRGSPPKSEKRQLLARRGSGAGGGAALLRKEKGDKDLVDSNESHYKIVYKINFSKVTIQ